MTHVYTSFALNKGTSLYKEADFATHFSGTSPDRLLHYKNPPPARKWLKSTQLQPQLLKATAMTAAEIILLELVCRYKNKQTLVERQNPGSVGFTHYKKQFKECLRMSKIVPKIYKSTRHKKIQTSFRTVSSFSFIAACTYLYRQCNKFMNEFTGFTPYKMKYKSPNPRI